MGVCAAKKENVNKPIDIINSQTQPNQALPSPTQPRQNKIYHPSKSSDGADLKYFEDYVETDRKHDRKASPIQQNLVCIKHHFSKHYSLLPRRKLKTQDYLYYDIQDNVSKHQKRLYIISKTESYCDQIIQGLKKHNLVKIDNICKNHPNIINIYELFETQNEYQLISECCQEQSLQEYIEQNDNLQTIDILNYIKQMAQIVQYLHSLNLTHGFLCLNSFSFVETDNKILKLTDFYSIFNTKQKITNVQLPFIPPEELDREQRTKARDCWALGIILYYMIKRSFPLKSYRNFLDLQLSYKQKFLDLANIDLNCQELINGLLDIDPNERFKTYQVLDNKCFFNSEIIQSSVENLQKVRNNDLTQLQECFLLFMINLYCPKQKQELFDLFSSQDIDQDGKISALDIQMFFGKIYPQNEAQQQTNELIQKLELDGDDKIEFQDYLICCIDKKEIITDERMEQTFKIFSMFRQKITTQQILSRFQNVSKQQVEDEILGLNSQKILKLNDFKTLMGRIQL